jgi:sulfur carrier protein ThiS adenylyltransferase
MPEDFLSILINEKPHTFPGPVSLAQLKQSFKPDADVYIVNGFPAEEELTLSEGDHVVLIKRGEVPSRADLDALMAARHSPGVHERMQQAAVGIAGLGGLGSSVAIALARMGIGTLILVDFDVVEPSNLNRQQYYIEHLGLQKTEAMRQILNSVNPHVEVVLHPLVLERSNLAAVFQDVDIIVECFDRADQKVMLLEAVDELLPDVYYVGASGLAGYGESNAIQSRSLGERIFLVGDLVTAAEPGQGLMAPRVGIAAHHQANLVVSLIMDPHKTAAELEDILD